MPLAATEYDQVCTALFRGTDDLGLDVAGGHLARGGIDPEALRKLAETLLGTCHEFFLYLHRGQQCLSHRFHGNVFHHVQQQQLGAAGGSHRTGAFADLLAVLA